MTIEDYLEVGYALEAWMDDAEKTTRMIPNHAIARRLKAVKKFLAEFKPRLSTHRASDDGRWSYADVERRLQMFSDHAILGGNTKKFVYYDDAVNAMMEMRFDYERLIDEIHGRTNV